MTSLELEGLQWMARCQSVLITEFDGDGVSGRPSKKTVNSLLKMGLLHLTEEDVAPDGFQFTPCFEVNDQGLAALKLTTE